MLSQLKLGDHVSVKLSRMNVLCIIQHIDNKAQFRKAGDDLYI